MDYTLPQIAAITGVPYATLRLWCRRCWMKPSYTSGNRARYTIEAVNEAKQRSVIVRADTTERILPRYEF